jgi:3-phosphoshikimate 1-carboxyvinyltransferase
LNSVTLSPNPKIAGHVTHLPSSKSISNRALVLQALGGGELLNLSAARDTRLMEALIRSPEPEINVLDAGTTMRFLTAYFAVTGQTKVLTGTDRMKERPIAPLVDALRTLGATIDYLGRDGFPPLATRQFSPRAHEIEIPGNISSQYISALMMVAPLLPQGLRIRITGPIASRPYIDMTARMMRQFGVETNWVGSTISIPAAKYKPTRFAVEGDWSAASYWYALVSLADEGTLTLPGLTAESLQGDHALVELMTPLGVTSEFTAHGLLLRKRPTEASIFIDFTHCPDLAQAILPVCAMKGIPGEFTGMESLRIKETDRIAALQTELAKVGASLNEKETGRWQLTPATKLPARVTIATYHDHRMAMGFAPWATRLPVTIQDPKVVDKSYPSFWVDLESVGIKVSYNS